ncbi:MAG: DUF3341 domain-containing protein [Calditrichaeota bacterium]|nr:MAG: DUF3341 domain-containing protein [Calditrichota bacterium]
MDSQLFLGVFTDEHDILEATKATNKAGYTIHDVYTPYAVHGLESAMGLKPSRLTYVCLIFGLIGLSLGVYAQFWIGSIDWPLNIGGKPFNSLPAYLPVIFELTVLIAGLGVVFSMFFRTKLRPGGKNFMPDLGVTNDRFVIALEQKDTSFNPETVTKLWEKFNVLEARKCEEVTN